MTTLFLLSAVPERRMQSTDVENQLRSLVDYNPEYCLSLFQLALNDRPNDPNHSALQDALATFRKSYRAKDVRYEAAKALLVRELL